MTNEDNEDNEHQLRIPGDLTLTKIASGIVVVTLAWAATNARIDALEKSVGQHKEDANKVESTVESLKKDIDKIQSNQNVDEMLIDNLYTILKRPSPQRHI